MPANADLPKVINSGVRALLLNPNAIFVAGGVSEKIRIPKNPNIKPLFSLLQDWSSFPNYDAECVHKKHNADYSKFIKIISTQKFLDIKPYWISNYNLQAREM